MKKTAVILMIFSLILISACDKDSKKTGGLSQGEEGSASSSFVKKFWDVMYLDAPKVSVHNTLSGLLGNNYNIEDIDELIKVINNSVPNKGKWSFEEILYDIGGEYYGVSYLYDANGKYLFVTELEYFGSGSSWVGALTYIFDTELIVNISKENIMDTSDPVFVKLVTSFLEKDDAYPMLEKETLIDSIYGFYFELFYDKNGVGLLWNEGTIGANALGTITVVIPFSDIERFLTNTGKEAFKQN